MADRSNAPIIIKRKKVVGGGGHHGGAWKVAMCIIPLLWRILRLIFMNQSIP